MDFISKVNSVYDTLQNKDFVNILWREIIKEERSDVYLDQLVDYSFHYPVDTDSYLEELNEKFDEYNKENLRTIDGHLKAYLVTFLYYCTKFTDRLSPKARVLASILYLKLIGAQGVGQIFFEKNVYKLQLLNCIDVTKDRTVVTSSKIYVIKLLKKYCLRERLEPYLLRGTANTIAGALMLTCKEDKDLNKVDPLPLYCMNALKEIIVHEEDTAQVTAIFESLFRCLRSSVAESIPNKKAAINTIIIFIKDVIQQQLDYDKMQYMLEAFCEIWAYEDFNSYKEAVVIMNILDVQCYKELIRKMVLYTHSAEYQKCLINIMHLLLEIVKNLPTCSLAKIEVLFSCAVRNVLYHFVDNNKKVSEKAIGIITEMCTLKGNPLLTIMFNQYQNTGQFINITVEALFLCIIKIADDKWGTSRKNQNLLIIFSKFLAHSENVSVELIQNTLKTVCKDATPFSLKSSLPILHELFCIMAAKDEVLVAQAILNIIFSKALHQDALSREYIDHIFQSMLKPSVINRTTYSQKYYCNIFLTSHFDYEALFVKCQKCIRAKDISNAIRDLDFREPGTAVLVCCLLDYCPYTETKTLATYIINNFAELSSYASSSFICAALEKILKNGSVSETDFPQLDVIQSLIMDGLFVQSFPIPSIKPAYDLFQTIRKTLKLNRDEEKMNQLLTITSERAFRRLHYRENGDDSVFMYLNEVCLLLKKPPSDNVLKLLETYMNDPKRISVLTMYMPDIYIQLLTLFTTIAMMNKSKVSLALKFLTDNLDNEEQIIKIVAYKLLFSLCQEITHEYGDVIAFAYKELVNADPCLVRICVGILEELIHDDYIKLNSESFFRFVYGLGCDDIKIFMREMLTKRFILSNQNDIAKFYIQSIVYMNLCTKLSNYPIYSEFYEHLTKIKLRIDNPKEIITFLFEPLSIRKKFNILSEIASIFDDLLKGMCKVDMSFLNCLKYFLMTFKLMKTTSDESDAENSYYKDICKQIEKQIVHHDSSYKIQCYYKEYESEIKRCTLILLKLLFFENEQLAVKIQFPLFDTIMHWIDFVKSEIIHYVHVDRGKEFGPYFSKLVQYYERNRHRFSSPESQLLGVCSFPEDVKFNVMPLVPGSSVKKNVSDVAD